jgi:uncharacterized protein
VEKNPVEAVRWWQKAAEQGLGQAQYNLGLAYHSGQGVLKDDAEAYFWINLAASSLGQTSILQARENLSKSLTQSQLADVQRRCREWAEKHADTQNLYPAN